VDVVPSINARAFIIIVWGDRVAQHAPLEDKIEERYNWLLRLVWIAILAATYAAIIFVCVYLWPLMYHWVPKYELLETMRLSVEHAATLVLIFYLVFEYATKASFVEQIKHSLINVLSAQERVFESLDAGTKRRFVSNSLKTTIGHDLGAATYSEIIAPYFDRAHYRSELKYIIRAIEGVPPFNEQTTQICKNLVDSFRTTQLNAYLWFDQSVEYKLIDAKTNKSVGGQFVICMTFDQMTLQKLFGDQRIFFREVIELDAPLSDFAQSLDTTAADDFIRNVLKLRLREGDGRPGDLTYVVALETDDAEGKSFIQITTKLPANSSNKLRLSFFYPRSKDAPWFIASLPQACFRPQISFSANTKMTKVEPIYFLSNLRPNNIDPGEGHDSFNITLLGWTFPTSGVMFTWRHRAGAPEALQKPRTG
jgi:hypothetical protein